MSGRKVGSTTVNGTITRCTDMESLNGQMEGNMKDSTKVIKNMVKVHFIGQMGESILEDGRMGNNMEKAHITLQVEKKK